MVMSTSPDVPQSAEVVRRDTARREHDVTTENSIGRIARDLTI
ncbi:hypothetical protein [Streptomyces sp. IB2014 016-6]|nr:hypothetical protein [Streptomyces sp. IB2014 016-6]